MYSFYQHPNFSRMKNRSSGPDGGPGGADPSLLLDADEHNLLCRLVERFRNVETLVLPSVCDDAVFYVVATTWCRCYKTFFVRDLRKKLECLSPASLSRIVYVCGQGHEPTLESGKSFMTLRPGANVIKPFLSLIYEFS
jgi:hypothetical protein